MKNLHTAFYVAAILLLIGLGAARGGAYPASQALAIPASCDTTTPARNAYRTGVTAGKTLVNQAWARVNDCDRIDYFLGVLEDDISRLTLPQNASASTVCRYTGTVDGVYEMLDTLYGTCSDLCFLDGSFAGEMSATVYCELSIALGGLSEADAFLRGPVQVCGLNFEFGCDSQFISITTTYENLMGVCYPYTEGEYADVWDEARNNQCAYVPLPPPVISSSLTEPESR